MALSTNNIVDKVLEYVDLGWSILPVKPDEKRPYMSNWVQYQKTRADRDMVNSWFSSLSNAGVGLVTGRVSGVIVLDVEHDCPIPIEDILKKYPTEMVSKSGGGGRHLFYSYPQGVGRISNRVRIFEGADLRADGGFIVLPPTLHASGDRYEWLRRGPMGAFPRELLDMDSRPKAQEGDGWICEALRGVTEGGRNDTCARLAGYFFKKGMSADIVEALLIEWNERNDPPMPMSEVRTTVKSIERSCSDVGRQFTSVQFEDDRSESGGSKSRPPSFDVMRMVDYVKGYGGGGVHWLVDDWLPDASITFLVSPPESYKTWMLLDLAVSVSAGVPFLGEFRVNDPGPTLIIQQEDSHAGLTDRLALIVEQKTGSMEDIDGDEWRIPVMPDLPIYVHPSRMLRFDDERVLGEMEKQIEAIRPRVVLIDPLYSTTSSVDGYMADLANQMMVLKTWRDRYGCSFLIAHHSRKNIDPDSTAREDSWGSQFLNAFLEAGWQIRRNPRLADNEVVVRRHSKVMGNQPPVSLTFDISTVHPMHYRVDVRDYQAAPGQGQRKPAQASLLDIIRESPMTQAELVQTTGKNRSTVSRQVRQLEAAGMVERMPDGKFKGVE